MNSDKNAIIIGLTGTPLIGKGRYSTDVFGKYIHKYYYNASIADGYTLRLIREGIETKHKMHLEQVLREINVLQGDLDRSAIYAHPRFVEPMLEYIINDFERSRMTLSDASIGAMVVCDSSEQAKEMFSIFNKKYGAREVPVYSLQQEVITVAAEPPAIYQSAQQQKNKVKTAALILHDIDTKDDRKNKVEQFKAGKIDLLLVYNMLLTGFDAKRLKKLYLGRVVRNHNLLQTLTRVNRPYKSFRFGFVVDFADIRKEFDATNKAYFDELQDELGDEVEHYSKLFKSPEEIETEIRTIKEKLFQYDTKNKEIFSQQITAIEDRQTVLELKKVLENARSLYNLIRLMGHYDLLERLDFKSINPLYTEVSNHLDLLNQKESLQNDTDTTSLLNVALEDIIFLFRKISEDELVLADQLKDSLRKTREALAGNFDKKDPAFVSLYDELKRLFDKKNIDEITQEEMKANIGTLRQIHDKINELNRKNNLLKAKYDTDEKYARIHKRLVERGNISKQESAIHDALQGVKESADEQILLNRSIVNNEGYFNQLMINLVVNNFMKKNGIKLDPETTRYINGCVVSEYLNQYGERN